MNSPGAVEATLPRTERPEKGKIGHQRIEYDLDIQR